MTLAYIRLYLALGIGHLSIFELNDLQKEIDEMIRARCDRLLEEDCSQIMEERRLSYECQSHME